MNIYIVVPVNKSERSHQQGEKWISWKAKVKSIKAQPKDNVKLTDSTLLEIEIVTQ